MKNLLISSDFPPVLGGIATVFYHIWKYLPQEFILLVPRARQSRHWDATLGMRVFRARVPLGDNIFKKLLRAFVLFVYTLVIVRRERVSYIQAGQPIIPGVIALFLKKAFKIRFNVWVYGGEIVKYQNRKFLFRVLLWVLKEADMVIANSEFTREVYVRLGISGNKIFKISPAVDADMFKPGLDTRALAARYNLGSKKVILTVARLSERKGHDAVIKALSRLKERFPELVYLVVGTGPDETRLKALCAESSLLDRVIFCGAVRDEELPLFYNLCDVYVMPNREVKGIDTLEGFGLSFIEASACGKAVIGGRSGGSSEAVADGITGYLVEPLSVDELEAKIALFLSDPDLNQRMGLEGRKRAIAEFQWQARAAALKELLSKT